LQEQFTIFCKQNNPKDLEEAINYFSVFGGLDVNINTSVAIEDLIEEIILDDYKHLRNIVGDIATTDPLLHAILSGVASGDRRTNSSFRRANVSFKNGMECVEELCDLNVLTMEKSIHHLTNQTNYVDIAKKMMFHTPFLRFWFAFVSPIFKGIRDGNYEEFHKEFTNKKSEFTEFIFEQLSHELLKKLFQDDPIVQIGRYWDDQGEVDLVAKTTDGKIIAASCKYTNAKVKKSVLTKLKEECDDIQLKVDIFVLFSKKGFTTEVKALKGEDLKLYTAKSFKALI